MCDEVLQYDMATAMSPDLQWWVADVAWYYKGKIDKRVGRSGWIYWVMWEDGVGEGIVTALSARAFRRWVAVALINSGSVKKEQKRFGWSYYAAYERCGGNSTGTAMIQFFNGKSPEALIEAGNVTDGTGESGWMRSRCIRGSGRGDIGTATDSDLQRQVAGALMSKGKNKVENLVISEVRLTNL